MTKNKYHCAAHAEAESLHERASCIENALKGDGPSTKVVPGSWTRRGRCFPRPYRVAWHAHCEKTSSQRGGSLCPGRKQTMFYPPKGEGIPAIHVKQRSLSCKEYPNLHPAYLFCFCLGSTSGLVPQLHFYQIQDSLVRQQLSP